MKITTINRTNFKEKAFPEFSEFTYNGNVYEVDFTEAEEVSMGGYIRTVKVFKDGQLVKSDTSSDPDYFATHSPNNKYLTLPNGYGVDFTNLDTGELTEIEIGSLIGIEFDAISRYCILNGYSESKLVDLNKLKVVFKSKNPKNHLSQYRFGPDNRVWSIEPWGQDFRMEVMDCATLEVEYFEMGTPFDLYNISMAQYERLIKSDKHCLWVNPGGGMWWSGFLNQWQYVPVESKIMYKTLVPTSEVSFSDNYKVDSCEAEFRYIEILPD